jgi:hypothetical protein
MRNGECGTRNDWDADERGFSGFFQAKKLAFISAHLRPIKNNGRPGGISGSAVSNHKLF